ncbi:type II toxin-antitoxin system VapC family toxin [Nocardia australiensis]|uniref:type II toxin-antitoxin system VapC family toxin n=1 Tax=Nocardia australiensis TaxID=2887191 RepID=UPI001D137DA4|nr:type II toxin-antitoxin system VapC family toxin [Nocardia australiensis]
MIILDTNVLSELLRPQPNPNVTAWVDSLPTDELATTAVCAAELWYGAARLRDGRQKSDLAYVIDGMINKDLRGRIEVFDVHAAAQYALIMADREQIGRPISIFDGQIAAICHTRNAVLATRNTKDFEKTGIDLVNPWQPT